jgi:hypothetical protein
MAASPAAIASSSGTERTVAELQIENLRLRQIVMNLLLEKIKLEEAWECEPPDSPPWWMPAAAGQAASPASVRR